MLFRRKLRPAGKHALNEKGASVTAQNSSPPPAVEEPPQPPDDDVQDYLPDPKVWAENFEESDHEHFIKMSAEAMQEAMNIAAYERNVDGVLNVAAHWANLALAVKDMSRGTKPGFGFGKQDEKSD